MKRPRPPVHPFLFAVYPPLFLFSINPGQASPKMVALAAVASAVVVALVWAALSRGLGNREKGAVVATLFAVLFFTYGHVHAKLYAQLMRWASGSAVEDALHAGLVCLAALIVWAVLGRVRRAAPESIGKAGSVLDVAGVVLCLFPLSAMAVRVGGLRADATDAARSPLPELVAASHGSSPSLSERPDIYYIVLDGWGRHDVLKSHFPEDDGAFLGALRRKGFQVLDESRANYYSTDLSLSSSLSLDYLDPVLGPAVPVRDRPGLLNEMIRNNRAAQYLRRLGYRFVHFGTSWGATSVNPYADEFVACRSGGLLRDEYVRVLTETTALQLFSGWSGRDLAECWNEQYDALAEMGPRPGPKFVFAHFLSPHHPYLFDRDGNILKRTTVSNQFEIADPLWLRRDLYTDQMVYTGKRILAAVERILNESAQPPVIVIVSDHGPHVLGLGLSATEMARCRLSNLMAVRLPGETRHYPAGTSSVNTFRILFNHLFNAGFEILPDRSFSSTPEDPYTLHEVPFAPVPPDPRLQAAGGTR